MGRALVHLPSALLETEDQVDREDQDPPLAGREEQVEEQTLDRVVLVGMEEPVSHLEINQIRV